MDTIAAIDLGSNSFRMQIAQVLDGELFPLDYLKDSVRLAGGLRHDLTLDEEAQNRAIACLSRFGQRLRGMPSASVRAVGTNTWRVAQGLNGFIARAEAALGYPIEIIGGREEARLIFLGATHTLPPSDGRRLVVDIGGGSTEFILGEAGVPSAMESLQLGCVAYTRRFFSDGLLSESNLMRAEMAARAEVQRIVQAFGSQHWDEAVGTSGTARSLAEVLIAMGLTDSGISAAGLAILRRKLIAIGRIIDIDLPGLRADRACVLPGGFAIMAAIFAELGLRHMTITLGALRDGVLFDLIGRQQQSDTRNQTVREMQQRYGVDTTQCKRVQQWALLFFNALWPAATLSSMEHTQALQQLAWVAKLHEVGFAIAHSGYHKHSAYIVEHSDMPGFSRPEQINLSMLILAQRGSLTKVAARLGSSNIAWTQILALRLAVLCLRSRRDVEPPIFRISRQGPSCVLELDRHWLSAHPASESSLFQEQEMWAAIQRPLTVRHLP